MRQTVLISTLFVAGLCVGRCDGDSGAAAGGQDGPCYSNGTCDPGLDCVDGQCRAPEEYCGDGRCRGTEIHDTCPEDCEPLCGDGVCDGGETTSSCPPDCPVPPFCGDGNCDPDETSASCLEDCPVEPFCGDGVCDPDETSASCLEDCPPDPFCGNDHTEGDEFCDGSDVGIQTCASQGFVGGTLLCQADCSAYSTAACHHCGNNLVDSPEVCDGTDLAGQDCLSLATGFTTGELTCQADCNGFDTSACDTVPCTDLPSMQCRICVCQQHSAACDWMASQVAQACYCGAGTTCQADCTADCSNPSLYYRTPACQACLDTASANSDPCFQVAGQACINNSFCLSWAVPNQDCN